MDAPYGETWDYQYNANYVYRQWKDPRGYSRYDTLVEKGAHHLDSVIGDNRAWMLDYDIEGNILGEAYIPLRGKKRKPGQAEYFYTYDYYSKTVNSLLYGVTGCICAVKNNLLKKLVGVTDKGDTTQYFTYKYIVDSSGRVLQRMKYYRTGQLHDSVGYVYY